MSSNKLFEALKADPLIYERFIDEMAARGIVLEAAAEKVTVSDLADALYWTDGAEELVASTPSLEMKKEAIVGLRSLLRYVESEWLEGDSYGLSYNDSPERKASIARAIRVLFADGNSLEVEAEICRHYGIKPGSLVPMISIVHQMVDEALGVYEGTIVFQATMNRLSAKQAIGAVFPMVQISCEEQGLEPPTRRLVEDILSVLGFMAILRKQTEIRSIVASPARSIEDGCYVAEVRSADEIADAYLECAQDGDVSSCIAKRYGVADGLSLQYGSLYGVHAVVVIYKDMTDVAGTRKPVARFLVERAICVSCGTVHTVISKRYADGATFSLSVAEFVAKSIADHIENSVLVGEDRTVCKVCSSSLMTVLSLPAGLDHPVWSDWAPRSLVLEVPNASSELIELRFSGIVGVEKSLARHMRLQELTGRHLDMDPISTQDPEGGRLYELACKLARTWEPPISTGRMTLMIGDAIRMAKNKVIRNAS